MSAGAGDVGEPTVTLLQQLEPRAGVPQVAASGRSAETPTRELSYLLHVLGETAPGRRVLDLGCGAGERAGALAAAGYEVTAVFGDHTESVLDQEWTVGTVDAAVCLHWPAASPESDQRRLLRRILRYLAKDGVLVIGHTPAVEIEPLTPLSVDHTPATPRRRHLMELELRARSAARLTARLRLSGFGVQRIDANFTAYRAASPASTRVQLVARVLPTPPEALAVSSWGTPAEVRLDLRYASDEAELLDPLPTTVWEDLVCSAGHGGAEIAAAYPVDDPYGGARGAEEVSRFFGVPVTPEQLTFAAGVTSLLHDLAGMADGGPVAAPELVHPDLEAWAVTRGSEIHLLSGDATEDRLISHLEAAQPAVLHLDRPDFIGRFLQLTELENVIWAAAHSGAVVVIDESAASYLGPAGSAATLVHQVDNLIVLRGFTKAYSLGGMRAGFAVSSPGVVRRVRELVTPMQVGELALRVALQLLAAGDVFGRLRARVREVKPVAVELLQAAGLEVIPNDQHLPWVGLADPGGTASRLLEARGIRALRPTPAPVIPAPRLDVLRLTIPLSDERVTLFRALLSEADLSSIDRKTL